MKNLIAKDFFRKNKKYILIVCIGIVFLAVVLLGTYFYQAQKIKSAMAYVDIEQNPSFLTFTNNVTEEDKPETVSLYTYGLGTEKEKISDCVTKDEYISYGNNERVLFMEDDVLYVKSPSSAKEKIAEQVVPSSYKFSGDGKKTLFLKVGENELHELYVYTFNGEKEKISSDISSTWTKRHYDISHDGTVVMFKDNENSLFIKNTGVEKEKIASDVDLFTLYSNDSFSYLTYNNSYYIKYKNDVETQKINNDSIGTLELCCNGLAVAYLGDFNFEEGCGELFLCTRGNDSIKIASSVTKFIISNDGTCIYYINDENMLFKKELPKIDDKSLNKSSKLYDEIVNGEKAKISSSILDFKISPTSKYLLYLDSENNLFYSDSNGNIKIASDIMSFNVYENSYVYITDDNKLYRNNNIEDIKNHKNHTKLLGENVLDVSSSVHGDYIAFANNETDELFAIFKDSEPKQIILDCKEYNGIKYYNSIVYARTLKFKDIIGNYENSDLNELYSINSEHMFNLYRNGVDAENSKMSIKADSEHSVRITFLNGNTEMSKSEYIIKKSQDGKFAIIVNGEEYSLSIVEDANIDKVLTNHKKVAEDRKKEEERLARVEEAKSIGQNYVNNGIRLSGYYKEYTRANSSSALDGTWPLDGNYYVFDYSPTSDGNSLWLKIYDEGYYWILVRV